ncbi:MAG TPA: porin family protein [Puia sp.]|nr:porin family protein [Puia sp.]
MNPRMKFVLISFVLLTTATATTYAQALHLGVIGGTNMYKVTGRSFTEKFKPAFSAGVYGEYTINRLMAIQPELLWNQVLARTDQDFSQIYPGAGVADADVYLNYISLPVMFAFKPAPELSILLGPQYSYLVDQTSGLLTGDYNGKDAFKKSDLALVFGGQLNLGKVKIGARYTVGLTEDNALKSDPWKYHGFHFYLGYRLK